ncbi:hypothetical protein EVAR_75697_1 [Eumeta japonica]|uniref:Uncharacterized protein n=1 Tax=Eumeta variegata TaxID=151549 RepID=A0A4C1W2X0_EUMVA|nr:hypothetical protein EVAR_75697_1 [Eumeta japonica]
MQLWRGRGALKRSRSDGSFGRINFIGFGIITYLWLLAKRISGYRLSLFLTLTYSVDAKISKSRAARMLQWNVMALPGCDQCLAVINIIIFITIIVTSEKSREMRSLELYVMALPGYFKAASSLLLLTAYVCCHPQVNMDVAVSRT